MISFAKNAISAFSTAYTCLAPALAANILRIPVPAPISRTILSLKS
jgi:hypothetical protein